MIDRNYQKMKLEKMLNSSEGQISLIIDYEGCFSPRVACLLIYALIAKMFQKIDCCA